MDIAVLDAIQQHLRTPLLDQIMLLATHLGDLALVWLVAGAVLVAQPRYRRWGVAVLLAVVATAILGMFVLKPLFGRARPFVAYEFAGLLIPPPSGDSFPSNHSMLSFAAAAALCCLPEKGRGVLALKVSAVAVACLIAFSRLYLYVHYPLRYPGGRRHRHRGRHRFGLARGEDLARIVVRLRALPKRPLPSRASRPTPACARVSSPERASSARRPCRRAP